MCKSTAIFIVCAFDYLLSTSPLSLWLECMLAKSKVLLIWFTVRASASETILGTERDINKYCPELYK